MRVWLKESGFAPEDAGTEELHRSYAPDREKCEINMIWLLFPVFDWSIIMIRPGGLLLVFPTYLPSLYSFSLLWVEVAK
jgi:hypothetical protein